MNKMKKWLISFFCCVNFLPVIAIESPDKVRTFYDGIKQLEATSNFNTANSIQQRMAACFMASENSGINLDMDGLGAMSSTLYTMKLHSMLFDEKSLKVTCQILATELAEQPDQNKGAQQKGAQHYITHVTKTYTQGGQVKTYHDVVTTYIANGLITEMANEESIGNTTTIPDDLTIEQLRARAAYCYSKGLFNQAYDYYEKLVAKSPKDGDASYRIALLTFWRKGCKKKFSSKKAAENKARSYLNTAIEYGSAEIKMKATNVKANWDNRNVYF